MIPEKPQIDIVVFPESAEVRALLHHFPETQRLLFSEGLPKNFLGPLYSAAEQLTIIEVPPLGRVIRFGSSSGFSDSLFINPATGEIIDVASGEVRSFVNSSLKQFGQTVTAVVERFPFYSGNAEFEDVDAAASDLSVIIRHIDPAAMADGLFWSAFTDDVLTGDYSTEDVVELDR